MEFLKRWIGNATVAAKNVMTESVREDLLNLAHDLGPVALGVGSVIGGALLVNHARSKKVVHQVAEPVREWRPEPTIVTKNYYFLDDAAKEELLKTLRRQV